MLINKVRDVISSVSGVKLDDEDVLRVIAAVGDVGIRDLEWEEVTPRCHDANGMGRLYRVRAYPDGTADLMFGTFGDKIKYASPEDARAAANVDFKTRIRKVIVKN